MGIVRGKPWAVSEHWQLHIVRVKQISEWYKCNTYLIQTIKLQLRWVKLTKKLMQIL